MHNILFKIFISLSILFIINTDCFAQRTCGSTKKMNYYLNKNTQQKEIRDKLEKNILSTNSLYTKQSIIIPVVFHIVYNTNEQNISDMQILSQLDVMNKDFNRTNSDALYTPSDFDSIVASMQISFCLAQRTPNGNPTNGIIRQQTNETEFQLFDTLIHYSSLGGSDAWDTEKYLNIWVTNIGGGILGWAQFPAAGNINTDGIVIDFKNFGTTGTSIPPYNFGRTTTHELGHYFNLFHIWGDNNCGDDYVYDTPIQDTANFGCKSHPHITCSNSGDMFMNFMDYTDDNCMNSFSIGQRNRTWSSINTYRLGLVTSDGCNPVIANISDANIEIISPEELNNDCNNPIYPKVLIKNKSTETLYTCLIKYRVNSSPYQYQWWNGNLNQNEIDSISLSGVAIGGSSHIIEVELLNPNNNQDIDTSDNLQIKLFQTTGGTSVNINLMTDNYANETSWYLYDANNNLIDYSDSLTNNYYHIYNYCLENSCYKLVINDTEGDGFCCNYGTGSISINKVLNNQEIAQLSYFNFSDTINFCITALNTQETLMNEINIYPIPTNGILYFNSKIFIKDIPIFAKVFDLTGKQLMSRELVKRKIDLSTFDNGIYILELLQGNQITRNKIIFKTHK